MYRILVACRAGVGSSLILKIKMNQVIEEYGLPIEIEHTNLDGVPGFLRCRMWRLSLRPSTRNGILWGSRT